MRTKPDNVRSLAAARAAAKRKPQHLTAFQPDDLSDIVNAIKSGEDERYTHVFMKAPPAGMMFAFTSKQAREVAKLLVAHADYVDGAQEEGEA